MAEWKAILPSNAWINDKLPLPSPLKPPNPSQCLLKSHGHELYHHRHLQELGFTGTLLHGWGFPVAAIENERISPGHSDDSPHSKWPRPSEETRSNSIKRGLSMESSCKGDSKYNFLSEVQLSLDVYGPAWSQLPWPIGVGTKFLIDGLKHSKCW